MSNITGTILDPLGVGIATTLTLRPMSTPTVDSNNNVIATSSLVVTTASNGTFTLTGVKAGDYEVTVGKCTRFTISVPADSLAYGIASLITSNLTYTYSGPPSGSVQKAGDAMTGALAVPVLRVNLAAITYASSIAVSLQDTGFQTVTLTGNVVLSTTNRAISGGPVRSVTLKILCDGTDRTLGFAAGIKFVGSKPVTIVANKTGILSLTSLGPNESDTLAAWAVET